MIEKLTLPNGVRLVHERLPHVRSASLGVWVGSGSRFEPAHQAGMSHFIEHMMFKGTSRRTAGDIAREMDAIGGRLNAFTSKECTCYFLKSLDSHLAQGIDTLCDMLFSSRFAERELALERGVIAEEIGMYEDSPEDLATEKLFEACFDGSGLGRPTLGSAQTLAAIDTRQMRRYVDECYAPERIVLSLCGSYSQSQMDELCRRFGARAPGGRPLEDAAVYHSRVVTRERDFEQNHLCLGFEGLTLDDERRYALTLLNAMIGGGMSSRLFQSVREERGLCYSVYSFHSSHAETGFFSIYTALNESTQLQALALIRQEIEDFCRTGPTPEELERVREQSKANILMGLESTDARMNSMGKSELFLSRVIDSDELVRRYDAVTRDEVTELARRLFDWDKVSLCAVGKVLPEEAYRRSL